MYANEGSACPSIHALAAHPRLDCGGQVFLLSFFFFLKYVFRSYGIFRVCPGWGCSCQVKHEFQGQEVDLAHLFTSSPSEVLTEQRSRAQLASVSPQKTPLVSVPLSLSPGAALSRGLQRDQHVLLLRTSVCQKPFIMALG